MFACGIINGSMANQKHTHLRSTTYDRGCYGYGEDGMRDASAAIHLQGTSHHVDAVPKHS